MAKDFIQLNSKDDLGNIFLYKGVFSTIAANAVSYTHLTLPTI